MMSYKRYMLNDLILPFTPSMEDLNRSNYFSSFATLTKITRDASKAHFNGVWNLCLEVYCDIEIESLGVNVMSTCIFYCNSRSEVFKVVKLLKKLMNKNQMVFVISEINVVEDQVWLIEPKFKVTSKEVYETLNLSLLIC